MKQQAENTENCIILFGQTPLFATKWGSEAKNCPKKNTSIRKKMYLCTHKLTTI